MLSKEVGIIPAEELFRNDHPQADNINQEIIRWKILRKNYEMKALPSSFAEAIKICDSHMFPNLFMLLKLLCTIPVTSCECERCFSALRRLDKFLRNSMHQERLSALALIHIHYNADVSLDTVVDIFAERNPRKLKFECSHLKSTSSAPVQSIFTVHF